MRKPTRQQIDAADFVYTGRVRCTHHGLGTGEVNREGTGLSLWYPVRVRFDSGRIGSYDALGRAVGYPSVTPGWNSPYRERTPMYLDPVT